MVYGSNTQSILGLRLKFSILVKIQSEGLSKGVLNSFQVYSSMFKFLFIVQCPLFASRLEVKCLVLWISNNLNFSRLLPI